MTTNCTSRPLVALIALLMLVSLARGERVLVKMKAPVNRTGAAAMAARSKAAFVRQSLLPGVIVIDTENIPGTLKSLSEDPSVAYAQRERRYFLAETIPPDLLFVQQWHHKNTGQMGGTAGADVRSTQAWDITTGSASVVLGIVDSGLDLTHPDLSSRYWINAGEIAVNGIDDDGNGFVDDAQGWNFADGNNDVSDVIGHGTAVASMAGSAANGTGVVGVDWNARLMVVKIFGSSGFSPESVAIDGVVYAINNGAKIINASWGDYVTSPFLADMAVYAKQNGCIIFAAAGNEGANTEQYPFYPANLGYSSVVSVSATDSADSPIFNRGRNIDFSAPGYWVYMARKGGIYGYGSGTSYASPVATAAAALAKAHGPSLDTFSLKYRLAGSSDVLPALAERNAVSGRLNAFQAVSVVDNTIPGAIQDLELYQTAYHGAVVQFTVPADENGAVRFYQVRASTSPISPIGFELLPDIPTFTVPNAPGTRQLLRVAPLDSGETWYIAIRCVDHAGNIGAISNVVSVDVPEPNTIFYDSCDTTGSVWTASGFTLAPGGSHTGTLSWQDSPAGEFFTTNTLATLTSTGFDLQSVNRPRLSFYMERLITPVLDRVTSLTVSVSTDGGSLWTIIREFHGSHSPSRLYVIPLDDLSGSADLRLRFTLSAGANTKLNDGVYIDDIRVFDGLETFPIESEQIIESVDYYAHVRYDADFRTQGTWTFDSGARSTAPRLEGWGALNAPAGTAASAVFTPFISTPGFYDVYATWGTQTSSQSVPYRITSYRGEQAVYANQQAESNRNRWVKLGRYSLTYGRGAKVTIDAAASAAGTVGCDAVMFRYAGLDSDATKATHWDLYD